MKKESIITIPRTIGFILLVIVALQLGVSNVSTLTYIASIVLILSALLFILTPKKLNENLLDLWFHSITDKLLLISIFLETLLIFTLYALTFLLGNLLQWRVGIAQNVRFDPAAFVSDSLVQSNVSTTSGLLLTTVASFIIWLLLCALAYTIVRGLQWSILLNKKHDRWFYARFLIFNLVWLGLWLGGFLFITAAIERSSAIIFIFIAALFFFHLNTISQYSIVKKNHMREGLAEGLSLAITQIHRFIAPYNFVFLTYFIIAQPIRLLPPKGLMFFAFAFIIIFCGWLKTYMSKVIPEL